MAGVSYRLGTVADAPDLAGLHRLAGQDRPWSPSEYADLLARSGAHCWLAIRDGAVTGFALAVATLDEAELYQIIVHPDARRTGIARQMMQDLCLRLKSEGVRRLYLEVADANTAAMALYRALGFEITGRRKQYYRYFKDQMSDAIVMAMDL